MVVHPCLQSSLQFAHVVVKRPHFVFLQIDGTQCAVPDLGEVEGLSEEVAGFGHLPAERDDLAVDGLKVAKALDAESPAVAAADGVISDLHGFSGFSHPLEASGKFSNVGSVAVEEIKILGQRFAGDDFGSIGAAAATEHRIIGLAELATDD